MNHTFCAAFLVGAAPLLLAGALATQELKLKPNQSALFALIEEFDPLDTSKLPFGRFSVRYEPPNGTPSVSYPHGYLVKNEDDMLTIRFVGLERTVIQCFSSRRPAHRRCAFDPMDIRIHARKVASELNDDNQGYNYTELDALILARDLARRGHARELEMIWSAFPKPDRLLSTLAWGISMQLIADFRDAALSHEDMLRRHQLWLRRFPKHFEHKYVTMRTCQLEFIVTEKRKRASSKKTESKTVEDLVFDLHDEFNCLKTRWTQRRALDPVVPVRRDKVTPLQRLQELGMRAVPALIDTLEDRAPSRCVMFCRRYAGSCWVLSVGSQAEGLLNHITGQPDQQRKGAKWWREWYADQQTRRKGAKQP